MGDYDNQGGTAGAFGYGLGETKPITRYGSRDADTAIRRDIYGNAVAWTATGKRIVGSDGKLRAEMVRDKYVTWMFCRPAEGCASCAVPEPHTCLVTEEEMPFTSATPEKKT